MSSVEHFRPRSLHEVGEDSATHDEQVGPKQGFKVSQLTTYGDGPKMSLTVRLDSGHSLSAIAWRRTSFLDVKKRETKQLNITVDNSPRDHFRPGVTKK